MGTKSETTTKSMDPRVAAQTDQLTSFANQLAGSQFDPYTGQRVANLSDLERQALSGYGALSLPSEFQEVSDIYRGMATRTPQARQADIDAYTQAYTSNVIDPTMAALNRQRAQQVVGEDAQMIQGNAFGSGRRGVYEGERQGAFEAAMGQTIGNLQAQGYQQAVNRANLEDQMRMGAAQALGGQAGQALQAQMGLLGIAAQLAATRPRGGVPRVPTRIRGPVQKVRRAAGYAASYAAGLRDYVNYDTRSDGSVWWFDAGRWVFIQRICSIDKPCSRSGYGRRWRLRR